MKKLLIIACGLALSTAMYAQKESEKENTEINPNEHVTIETNTNGKKTTIELRNGQMFVDGKKVEGDQVGKNLKIIRKLGKGFMGSNPKGIEMEMDLPQGSSNAFGNFFGNDEVQSQAMLGVKSEATEQNNGAHVLSVSPKSPAELMGLKQGDVVTKIDNMTITNPTDLANAVANYKPGDKVNIQYQRNGQQMEDVAVLSPSKGGSIGDLFGNDNPFGNNPFGGENPFGKMFGNGQNPFDGMMRMFKGFDNNNDLTNFDVANADAPRIGAQVEERADNDGVRISEIKGQSIAEKGGLKVDDVITNFGGNNIKSIDDLSNAIAEIKNKKDVVVTIKRGKELRTIYLEIPVQLRKKDF